METRRPLMCSTNATRGVAVALTATALLSGAVMLTTGLLEPQPADLHKLAYRDPYRERALARDPDDPWAGEILVYYDASGRGDECAEAPYDYMARCIYMSDYLSYFGSPRPRLARYDPDKGMSCIQLGYDYVSTDPAFPGFELFWRPNGWNGCGTAGGCANARQHSTTGGLEFVAFLGRFIANDFKPDLIPMLQFARDNNPACANPVTAPNGAAPYLEDTKGITRHIALEPMATATGGAARRKNSKVTATYFDARGASPMCMMGPHAFMRDCQRFSNMLMWSLAWNPYLLNPDEWEVGGSLTCETLPGGFERIDVPTDFSFSDDGSVTVYWKGGQAAYNKWLRAFLVEHADIYDKMKFHRKMNPACGFDDPTVTNELTSRKIYVAK